jgi:hypothetical protein
MRSTPILTELKMILPLIQEPLLSLFVAIDGFVTQNSNNPATLKPLFSAICLVCEIFQVQILINEKKRKK